MLSFLLPQKGWGHTSSSRHRQTVLRYARAALYLFNLHTLLLTAVACLAVYVCDRWRVQWNQDFTLVATGTTFPLVFTIQQAFTRREKALSLIANLKASAVGLYWMHRDWCQDDNFPASMGNDHNTAALQCKMLLVDLLQDIRAFLVADSQFESLSEQRLTARRSEFAHLIMGDLDLSAASQMSFAVALEKAEKEDTSKATAALRRCYRGLSRLSVANEKLGLRAGYTRGGEGGMSRTNQYLRYIMSNLEELRYIKQYRTPIMMRAAHGVLLHLFAVFLAPFFVHYCDSWTALGYSRETCPAGYASSITYCLITMLLFKTQQDLENPFDQLGLDDVFFDLRHELEDACFGPMASMAATPCMSGNATPRTCNAQHEACGAGGFCSSPNPRSHPDLCWPQSAAPWAQQKLASAAGGTSISRRGSTLGTVTEEECLIPVGVQQPGPEHDKEVQGPTAAATGSTASSMERSGSGQTLSSSQHPQHVLRVSVPHHSSQQLSSHSPLSSPRHSGAGGCSSTPSTLRSLAAAAGAPAAASVATVSVLRHRSPCDRQQQQQPLQTHPQDVELAATASVPGRRNSSGGGDGSSSSMHSDSDVSLEGDSSTQLIRTGAGRSDDFAD